MKAAGACAAKRAFRPREIPNFPSLRRAATKSAQSIASGV
jgi:hypothetical protein